MAEMRTESSAKVELRLAVTWMARLKGLLGTNAEQRRGMWLLIAPCSSVHTIGMRYPIDIAFLDRNGAVICSRHDISPGRLYLACKGACAVLERVSGGDGEPWPVAGSRVAVSASEASAESVEYGGPQ